MLLQGKPRQDFKTGSCGVFLFMAHINTLIKNIGNSGIAGNPAFLPS